MTKKSLPGDEVLEILDNIEVSDGKEGQAVEVAADAVAFAQSFWSLMKEHNLVRGDVLDFNLLESGLDMLAGELSAACYYLSSPVFKHVPDTLRRIATKLDGNEDTPEVVKLGFRKLADRVENTKLAIGHYSSLTDAQNGGKVGK